MIQKNNIANSFLIFTLSVLLASCASTSSSDLSPQEIGQNLGYERIIAVENVPAPATFTLESVNSRTTVMGGRFGVRYLIVFGHNCPEAGFGNLFDTTATAGQLDAEDSIIIDDETYCRISEIYVLE